MRAKLKLKFIKSHLFEFEPRGNLHEIGQANYVIKKKMFPFWESMISLQNCSWNCCPKNCQLKPRRMCCIACYELTCTFNSNICQQIDGRRHDFVNAVQFGHFMLQVKPCDICGDGGWPEQIATCYLCKSAREHMYGCYLPSLLAPCVCSYCVVLSLSWLCLSSF